ncbi:unnamed protein product [Closterium sp. NIES-64]|nr:unnamed protein product [Closterium sp. NIES-64]
MRHALPFRFRQFSISAVSSAPGTLPSPASPAASSSSSLSPPSSPLPTHGEGMVLERAAVSTAEFTAHDYMMDGGVEEVLDSRFFHVAATATSAAAASFPPGTGQQISTRHVTGRRDGQPSASFNSGGRSELRDTDVKDDGSTGGGEGRAEVLEDTDKTASCPHAATGLVDAGGGKVVNAMGMRVRIKAEAEQTGGSYSVIEYEVPAGEGTEEHIHTREHEAWFLLDGQMTWTIEKETYQASQGSFMHMPLGRAHSFHNNSDRPARMLVVCMPGGLEKYFLEIGDPEEAAGKAPEQSPGGAVHKPVVEQAKLQNAIKKAMLYGLVYPKGAAA